jgi:hypothetical protein
MAELKALVEQAPDPERDGVVRWRRVDPQAQIKARFDVAFHERSVGQVLHRLGFAHLSARPKHPASDLEAQAALPGHAAGKPIEIWFQDEARVGQQGTLPRIRARRGTRPRAPRDRRYGWAYLFGAVCPERATAAASVLPYANADAMNRHLEEISRHVAPGAHAVLVLAGAGRHGATSLAVPRNISLLPLPRYSPELNPIENIRQYLRQNQRSLRIWPDYEAIVDTCCQAWNALIAMPNRLAAITRRDWAKTVNI